MGTIVGCCAVGKILRSIIIFHRILKFEKGIGLTVGFTGIIVVQSLQGGTEIISLWNSIIIVLLLFDGSTELSVRSGRDLIDGSTSIQMEYIIAQMVLPSLRSRPDLTDSSVYFTLQYTVYTEYFFCAHTKLFKMWIYFRSPKPAMAIVALNLMMMMMINDTKQ